MPPFNNPGFGGGSSEKSYVPFAGVPDDPNFVPEAEREGYIPGHSQAPDGTWVPNHPSYNPLPDNFVPPGPPPPPPPPPTKPYDPFAFYRRVTGGPAFVPPYVPPPKPPKPTTPAYVPFADVPTETPPNRPGGIRPGNRKSYTRGRRASDEW